jgi:NADH-quinone oxidoreductase subunit E
MTESPTRFSQQDIVDIAAKWKDRQGSLIMVLHEIQNKYGYVPRPVSLALSAVLDIPLARIYEVITFYNYFKLEPPGKYNIAVCLGTACYLKGAPEILGEIKALLDIEEGETTRDGLFHLDPVRCLGCCSLAPVISVNGKIYGRVKKSDVMGILSEYQKKPA